MRLPRRKFLHLAAGAAALPAVSRIAWAQTYPSRPVSLIVFVPAGGTPDIIARLIGQSLSQRLGQSVVIDNRPGAGGNLALQAVARAPADGYTLLMVATPHAINVTLYEKSTVTVTRDIVPVASINNDSFVLPCVGNVLSVAITATCRRTRSANSSGKRSYLPSSQWYSTVTFLPSTYPVSLRPLWKPPTQRASPWADPSRINPITGIAGCCDRAASGHATVAPPSSVMNSRRFIRSIGIKARLV
jgi:Tripartite tricarboxylate transporter family receptor